MKEKILKHKVAIILTIIFLLTFIGSSFAYFTLIVTGEGKEIDVTSADKSLEISDNHEVNFGAITPGWTGTTTISITNTGTVATYYNLVWESLTNNLSRKEDFTMKISSTNNGGTLSKTEVSSTGANIPLINDILIEPDVTQTYTISFEFANLVNEDQTVDSGKTFNGVINFTPSTKKVEESTN